MATNFSAITPTLPSGAIPISIVPTFEAHRILRTPDVCNLLGRSKSMLYLDIDPKSKYYKPDFPKPIRLSARSIGWRAQEVYAYIASLAHNG